MAVTIQGKPAEVTGSNQFSRTTVVPSGASSIQVAAKDYSGNLRTNTYEVTQSGSSTTYTYDANGNTTGDGTRTFEWDAENRLLAIEAGTHRSEFTYDGLSRRVRIVEKDSGSTTSDHWFLWCGLAVCEERDNTGGTVTKRFFGQGEEIGSTDYFYTTDHLGSVREMTDGSGAIQARYDYDPYGRRTKLSGAADAAFGFTGHLTHVSTGLVLTLFRGYDPETGRWLSQDPLGLEGGLNLYAYVAGDPANLVDPLGLSWKTFGWGFVKGAAVGVVVGIGVGLLSPALAAVATGALVVYSAVGLYQLYSSWGCMTADQQDEAIGGIVGGIAGGYAGVKVGAAGRGSNPSARASRTNKVKPVTDAQGPHTTWKTDPVTGEITRHETWTPNPLNPSGWDKVQSTDLRGAAHVNTQTGASIPTPHTQGKGIPGGVRSALPSEIPKGGLAQ